MGYVNLNEIASDIVVKLEDKEITKSVYYDTYSLGQIDKLITAKLMQKYKDELDLDSIFRDFTKTRYNEQEKRKRSYK